MLIEYTLEEESTLPGIEKNGLKYICNRCLNKDPSQFYQDELGIYCLKCLIFGKSSTYNIIHRRKIEFKNIDQATLSKVIYLSEMQGKASKECVNAYKMKTPLLIFAVCGAGKTEIVYDVILNAINEGKVVCFATPRKDVVLELVPRFKRDFVNVDIIALHAGSLDKGKLGSLFVSTTHQLINFYHFFDLVILDEVDAFPYYNNRMLEGFIDKAKKPEAPIIYLTATPTKKLKKAMSTKKLKYFVIPARFHRHPIPYPKVVLTNNTLGLMERGVLHKKIYNWLNEKRKLEKQVFIFVPEIKYGLMLEKILMEDHFNCQFVHAGMKERKEIINRFRQGNLRFIITTTILERGVTVSNVDVCIIKCDDEIFDERSIVQIVGRAGRDRFHPTANVLLFADEYTLGIKDSLKHIKAMNKVALKEGLVDAK